MKFKSLLLTSLCCYSFTVEGVIRSWNTASTSDWNTAGNWSPVGVPGSMDSLVFPNQGSSTTSITATNDIVGLTNLAFEFSSTNISYTLAGNSFSVPGNIIAASIKVDAGAPAQTISNPIALNGSVILQLDGTGTFTLSGQLTDGIAVGGLDVVGTETLQLSNGSTNSYTGPTFFSENTIQIGSGTPFGTGTVFMGSGMNTVSILQAIGTVSISNEMRVQGPIGDMEFDSNGQTMTLTGLVDGSGSFTSIDSMGTGTVVITGGAGLNTYMGGTTVNSGSTLNFTTANAFSNSGANVAVNGTLNMNFTGSKTIGQLTGAGTINLGSAGTMALTVTGGNFTGGIKNNTGAAGIGSLTLTGTGTLTLADTFANPNTYSGGTTIATSGGTVSIGTSTSLGTGTLTMDMGTTLNVFQSFFGNVANPITLSGTGTQFTIANGASLTLSNAITGGAFAITKSGGPLQLDGTNSYTGGTNLNSGFLIISNNSSLGGAGSGALVMASDSALAISGAGVTALPNDITLTGNAFIDANGVSSTLNGNITGPDNTLTFEGGGTVTMGGPGSLQIPSILNASTNLIGTTTTLAADITDNGSVTFNQAVSGTYSKVISGSGTATIMGGGNITIAVPGSLQVPTIVNAGSGLTGTTSTLLGIITDNGSVTFNQATSGTYSNVLSGTGTATIMGGGTVTIAAPGSLQVPTIVNAGSGLTGTTATLLSNITDNGTVTFDQTSVGTYAGVIGGTGKVVIQGSGAVTFSGINTYSGTTTISSGSLFVDGSIANSSLVTVASGGFLGGTGTVGPTVNNGIVQPGDAPGTLTVINTYVQTGTYNDEITADGRTNLINVIGSPATATLGGSLNIMPDMGVYMAGTEWVIVSAPGGVSGTFATANLDQGPLQFTLFYPGTEVILHLITSGTLLPLPIIGANANAVFDCLETLSFTNSDARNVLNTIAFLNDPSSALDQLQPAMFGAYDLLNVNSNNLVVSLFNHHTSEVCCMHLGEIWGCTGGSAWLEPFGYSIDQKKMGEQLGFDAASLGIAGGLNYCGFYDLMVGIGGAYSHENIKWDKHRGRGQSDSAYVGVYVDWLREHYYLEAALMGTLNFYNNKRRMKFSSIFGKVDRIAHSENTGYGFTGHVGGGGDFAWWDVHFKPFGNVDFYYQHRKSFHESGAHALNLKVQGRSTDMLRSEAGLSVSKSYIMSEYGCFAPTVWLSCVNEAYLEKKTYNSSFQDGTCVIRAKTFDKPMTFISPGVDIAAMYTNGFSFAARAWGEFNDKTTTIKADLRLEYDF